MIVLSGRERQVRGALYRFGQTKDGQLVFKAIQEDLIKLDLYDKDRPHLTSYNCGKRDALRDLLIAAKAEIKDLNINYEQETQL